MQTWEIVVTIVGLTAISLVTRGFFILPRREIPLPGWLRQGLRYAPLAAMAAIIAPELLTSGGHVIQTWRDARLFGAAAGAAMYFWRRDILATIVAGTATMLLVKHAYGW